MFSQKSGKENSNIFIVNTAFCPICVNAFLQHHLPLLMRYRKTVCSFLEWLCVVYVIFISAYIYLLSSHVMYIDLLKNIPHQTNSLSLYPYRAVGRFLQTTAPPDPVFRTSTEIKNQIKYLHTRNPRVAYYVYYVRDFPSLTITRHILRNCTTSHTPHTHLYEQTKGNRRQQRRLRPFLGFIQRVHLVCVHLL